MSKHATSPQFPCNPPRRSSRGTPYLAGTRLPAFYKAAEVGEKASRPFALAAAGHTTANRVLHPRVPASARVRERLQLEDNKRILLGTVQTRLPSPTIISVCEKTMLVLDQSEKTFSSFQALSKNFGHLKDLMSTAQGLALSNHIIHENTQYLEEPDHYTGEVEEK